jgi:hypothetical protein
MTSSILVWFLRALFVLVLGSMLWVTSWASLQCPLFAIPLEVYSHPWFIATLVDAYWGFITFFVWVAWKEESVAARILWFLAVMLLGNIAMALYFLRELSAVRTSDEIGLVFTRRNPGYTGLAGSLLVASFLVYLLAWLS